MMVSKAHIRDVLRQGFWASLTGGWFYDPRQNILCNTIHLYLWIFLLCMPFTFYLMYSSNVIAWCAYSATIFLQFSIIKLLNHLFHYIYDNSEIIQEESTNDKTSEIVGSIKNDGNENSSSVMKNFMLSGDLADGIELSIMDGSQMTCFTPPIRCSSQTSLTDCSRANSQRHTGTKLKAVDSMEYINKMIKDKKSSIKRQGSGVSHPDGNAEVYGVHETVLKSDAIDYSSFVEESGLKDKHDQTETSDRYRINSLPALQHVPYLTGEPSVEQKLFKNPHLNTVKDMHLAKNNRDIAAGDSVIKGVLHGESVSNIVVRTAERDEGTVTSVIEKSSNIVSDKEIMNNFSRPPKRHVRRQRPANPDRDKVCQTRAASSRSLDERQNNKHHLSFKRLGSYPGLGRPKYVIRREKSAGKRDVFVSRTPVIKQGVYLSNKTKKSDEVLKRKISDYHSPRAKLVLETSRTKTNSPSSNHRDVCGACALDLTSSSTSSSSLDQWNVTTTTAEICVQPTHSVDCCTTVDDGHNSPTAVNQPVWFLNNIQPSNYHHNMLILNVGSRHGGILTATARSQQSVIDSMALDSDSDSLSSDYQETAGYDTAGSSSTLTNEALSPVMLSPSDTINNQLKTRSNQLEELVTDAAQASCVVVDDNTLEWPKSLGAIPKRHTPVALPRITTSKYSDEEETSVHDDRYTRKSHATPAQHTTSSRVGAKPDRKERAKQRRSSDYLVTHPRGRKGAIKSKRPRKSAALQRVSSVEKPSGETFPPDCIDEAPSSRESSTSKNMETHNLLRDKRPVKPPTMTNSEWSELTLQRRQKRHAVLLDLKEKPSSSTNDISDSIYKTKHNHLAKSFDDTTDGATHYFYDEHGNLLSYSFGTKEGEAKFLKAEDERDTSSGSQSFVLVESPSPSPHFTHRTASTTQDLFSLFAPRLSLTSSAALRQTESLFDSHFRRQFPLAPLRGSDSSSPPAVVESKPKFYYKFFCCSTDWLKIRFDRLALVALLDRNTIFQSVLSTLLAVSVSILGAVLLANNFYRDMWMFLFCFVIASCHYSLLKSVQPDAASPMHGYNAIVVYSRSFYFCLCCSLVWILHIAAQRWSQTAPSFVLYGVPFTTQDLLIFGRDLVRTFILFFPIIFAAGLLPQVNTFIMYIFEQLHIHVFGGNACTSLQASAFSLCRCCLVAGILYAPCYFGMQSSEDALKPNTSYHVIFSLYCGMLVSFSYHLSRCPTDPSVIWQLVKNALSARRKQQSSEPDDLSDPLPSLLQHTVRERLKSDLLTCIFICIVVFAISVSTVFTTPVLQPVLFSILVYVTSSVGLFLHYILPQLRKEMPWLCCSHPALASAERALFEVRNQAKVMWFEKMYVWLRFFERNFLYVALFLNGITQSAMQLVDRGEFQRSVATVLIVVGSIKMLQSSFSDTSRLYIIVIFTFFLFKYDYSSASETFVIDYFFTSLILNKFFELLLKTKFILTYIAPWQITWGSAFHAFAQPFSVPHSAMLFVQAIVSSALSAPLNPILGSAIFITSYVRPIKFWERDYNTKRVDHSNTRLALQLETNPGADEHNLNSIFYEHLSRSLQRSLCGDLQLGRWGVATQGDCYIMTSDNLSALVHIIEVGNGLVTFQLRGFEFRGTYCHLREVEAITESVEDDEGFCCCSPGHLPHFLSLNAAFGQRWLAWEVVATKYVLEGYSISDNSAASMLQVFDLRKVLITLYIKSIVFYTIRSAKLDQWLSNETIQQGLKSYLEADYVDVDPTFHIHVDDDYDSKSSGVSKEKFCNIYLDWIVYCARSGNLSLDVSPNSWLVALCFGLSLLGRRTLGAASHNGISTSLDFFLFGLHALFKGDFRVTSSRDEWVFSDMDLLKRVVAPAVRMSLKLHQDHFTSADESSDNEALYTAICSYESTLVIAHEADPSWRNAVLSNKPSLLALRHVFTDGSDEYKVIMLNKRHLNFRVIKLNRECVRGLWAGQLQELIYLRNANSERGSIQNAKQVLRNMINSSCDQPIGYPIYVSPLMTSYSSTNVSYTGIVGREFGCSRVVKVVQNLWFRLRDRCGAHCTGASRTQSHEEPCGFSTGSAPALRSGRQLPSGISQLPQLVLPDSSSLPACVGRGSMLSISSGGSKQGVISTLALTTDTLSSAISHRTSKAPESNLEATQLNRRAELSWSNELPRENVRFERASWGERQTERNMEGVMMRRWVPSRRSEPVERRTRRRSHEKSSVVVIHTTDKDSSSPVARASIAETSFTEI